MFFKYTIKFFKILLIIYLVFILGYFSVAIFNRKVDNTFRLEVGNYKKNPIWMPDKNDTIIDEIYATAETDGALSTAYNMYLAACKKLMLTKDYGIRATGLVDVSASNLKIDVITNRTEQYHVVNEPVLNANQKVLSSYTNTIYVTEVSDKALSSILIAAIQFADRGFADGTNYYKQKGKLERMDEQGENVVWKTDYSTEKPPLRTYNDSDIREKCNFVITLDTIVADSVKIEREYDETYNSYLYHVSMDLDCTSHEEGSATYYESKAIKDLLGSNMKSLVYSQMKVDFTIYSNGYFITWNTVQEWTLEYSLSFLGSLSGTALNRKSEVFSYDKRECAVMDFTAN